ncbi:unnamed protein product [Trichobilharzia szidati]|nr:unnamed protein product [Trichobilharzia szidati]
MPSPREFTETNSGSRRGRRSYIKAETLNKGMNCEPIIFHRNCTKRIISQSPRGKPKRKAGRPRKYKLENLDSPSFCEGLDSSTCPLNLSSDKMSCKRQRRLSKDDSESVVNQKSDKLNIKVKIDESPYKQLTTSSSPERPMDEPIIKIKKFTCQECGMQFKTKGRFDKHIPCRVHRGSEYVQKPQVKRGRKSLNSKSLNNMKLLPSTVQRKGVDDIDEYSLLVRILGKSPKSYNCAKYMNDENFKEADDNSSEFSTRKSSSITGTLKFNISPNHTVEFLVSANLLAVKQCISLLDNNNSAQFNGVVPLSTLDKINVYKTRKDYLTEINGVSSSLPFTCLPSYHRSVDSVLVSSTSSVINANKEKQVNYNTNNTNHITSNYQNDYSFLSHNVMNLSSNPLLLEEFRDRSQDELQAARTILSLAHGATDIIFNMGQITMDIDNNNASIANNNNNNNDNLCELNTYNTDVVTNVTESRISGDEVAGNSQWASKHTTDSFQQGNELNSKSTAIIPSIIPGSIQSNSQSNMVLENNVSQATILHDSDKCISQAINTASATTTIIPAIQTTTDYLMTSTAAVTMLTTTTTATTTTTTNTTSQSSKSVSDTWHPISSSQNNISSNNNHNNSSAVHRKIRPPPKKRLSTNYSRSNSSRSLADSNNTPTKSQDNANQIKSSFSSSTTVCEPLVVANQPIKPIISVSAISSYASSTDHIDTLSTFSYSSCTSSTSGVGLVSAPIQLTNVVYGNPNLIPSHTTSLTPFIPNQDLTTHPPNPMNAFTMVFPTPRPITPTPQTINGTQPSFFILPQLMVLPRFVGSYIPMISAPEPYPSIINPVHSSSLTETRSSTFMTSSLVTPIPTVQPDYSTNQPVRTIILQPPPQPSLPLTQPMSMILGSETVTTQTSSDDSHLKPINHNLNSDEIKELNTSDSNNVIVSQQSEICSVKDKLLLPTLSNQNNANCSKKSELTKCIWSGPNITKPVPIRPVPEAFKVRSSNVLPSLQSKSVQEHQQPQQQQQQQQQQHHGLTGQQQTASDQKVLSTPVTYHDMTNNWTKTTVSLTTAIVNTITDSPAYIINPPPSPICIDLVSPVKTSTVETTLDTSPSCQTSQQSQNKLVTILPANQSDKINKFQYRSLHYKKRLNFVRHNNYKKCLSTLHNLQVSTTNANTTTTATCLRGKYRCQDFHSLHSVKSYPLRKHWRTHTGIRPYICHHCDISFTNRGNLSKHMKSRCHHDKFLKDSGLTQMPLSNSISDSESQFNGTSNNEEISVEQKDDNDTTTTTTTTTTNDDSNNTVCAPEDLSNCSKASVVASTSPSSVSCKTRNSKGAVNSCSIPMNNKRNQDNPSTHNDIHAAIPKSSSTAPPSPVSSSSNLSLKSSVLQFNTCSHVSDSSNRIPAPNVNAVNLSQDLPMNLSAKPQEPIALIRYVVDPSTYAKMNGIQPANYLNHHHHHTDNLYDKQIPSNCLPSAEVIVQTAVEAARSLASDKPNLRQQTNKSNHSTPDSKYFEKTSSPGSISGATKHTDIRKRNCNTSNDFEEQHFPKALRTSTPNHLENKQNDKPCLLPRPASNSSSCGSAIICTEDSSSNKLNKDTKQNNKLETTPVTPTTVSSKTESPPRQNHGVKSHNCLKDPRPYKCNTCDVGFRVTGHLYKHYRSKTHMSNILQMAQLSSSTIERVLQCHNGNPQLINPDTGELIMTTLEKLIPTCEIPTTVPVNTVTNGHN